MNISSIEDDLMVNNEYKRKGYRVFNIGKQCTYTLLKLSNTFTITKEIMRSLNNSIDNAKGIIVLIGKVNRATYETINKYVDNRISMHYESLVTFGKSIVKRVVPGYTICLDIKLMNMVSTVTMIDGIIV